MTTMLVNWFRFSMIGRFFFFFFEIRFVTWIFLWQNGNMCIVFHFKILENPMLFYIRH